tara:strand:+ start:255 stop:1130 length:876 start_codon:yes stop_codon:yes gene_type:complete
LLSLAQSANYLFCLEWTSSDTGPKVLQYKKIKFNTSQESYKNFLDTCLINFKKSSINQSNSISLSIDIDNLFLTSFNYDLNIDIVDYTKWYETNILNPYIVKNFDIYYYPLNNKENSMMVVCINKTLKANIIASCKKHKYELVHLTSDIFSAGIAARVYRKNNIKNYLIWKIGKNNYHYGLLYENDDLKHFIKIRKKNKIECIQSIGDKFLKIELIKMFESAISGEKLEVDFVDKIFLYQSKTNFELLKFLALENKIHIMDIGSKLLGKKNPHYSLLGYNENINSLRGIDV